MELTADTVHQTFIACLFNDGEPTESHVIGEGVTLKIGFHPERLKAAEPIISELLDKLPNEFKKTGGGGWTFLNMCNDKNGNQWTGFHRVMDELVTMGIAAGKVSFLMPREMWEVFPGGMPYVVIN